MDYSNENRKLMAKVLAASQSLHIKRPVTFGKNNFKTNRLFRTKQKRACSIYLDKEKIKQT